MRLGPDTGILSGNLMNEWKKAQKGSGRMTLCPLCNGMGYKRDRIAEKTEECPKCKGWGMFKNE